jgi:hypothetical protein
MILYDVEAPGGLLGAYNAATSRAQLAVPESLQSTKLYTPGDLVPEDPRDPRYGALLLAAVDEWFAYWARYPSMAGRHRVLGWAFHTHLRDAKSGRLLVPASPRLILLSDEGNSGKSTVLELLNLVCAKTDGLATEPTEPAFRSMIGPEHLTVLLDEAEILFGRGRRKEAIRAEINACTYPNGHVDRIQGGVRVKDPVFAPVAIAALATMKHSTGGVLDTMFSRALEVFMSPPDEDIPEILEDKEGQKLGRQARLLIAQWTQLHMAEILDGIPAVKLPEGVRHREAQIWRPLLSIFQVAGGPWPQYGHEACVGRTDKAALTTFSKGVRKLGS